MVMCSLKKYIPIGIRIIAIIELENMDGLPGLEKAS